MTSTTQNTQFPKAVSAPQLPVAPGAVDAPYMNHLTKVLQLFFTLLTNLTNQLLQNIGVGGSVTFVGSTTATVIFSSKLPNTSYYIGLSGNQAGYCWVPENTKTTSGFVIYCSVSNSNTMDWVVINS
jgi:hypothetical protein